MMRVLKKSYKGYLMRIFDNHLTWNKHIIGYINDKRQYSNDWNINIL